MECMAERAMRQECQYILRAWTGIPKRGVESRHTRTHNLSLEVASVRLRARARVRVCHSHLRQPSCVRSGDGARRSRKDVQDSLGTSQGQDTISLSSQM